MISVLIPAFREVPLLKDLLKDLLNDGYEDKEIIVSIDEPSEKSTNLMKEFNNVSFIINKERKGKAKALNAAADRSKGGILLFLDSDVKIRSRNFLSKISEQIEDVDIVDIKKTLIEDSRISKMSNYEFMTSNLLTHFFSKMRRCIGINGVAFAIKKHAFDDIGGFSENIVLEDLEFGMQSYLKNKSYKYSKEIEVSTKTKNNWKEWLVQRKRYGIGGGQFFRLHWRELSKAMFRHINITLMILFLAWPLLFTSLIFNTTFENFILLSLFSLSFKFSFLLPIFLLTGFGFLLIKNIFAFFITYGISSILFFIMSKKLGFPYDFKYYTLYYFFYSPLWFSVFFYNFIRGLLYRRIGINLTDWKL